MWDDSVFDWYFDVCHFFMWHPGRIFGVAAVFGVLFLAALIAKTRWPQLRCWPLAVALVVWLVFSECEVGVQQPSIRIDVDLTWPVIFIATAFLILLVITRLVRVIVAAKQLRITQGHSELLSEDRDHVPR